MAKNYVDSLLGEREKILSISRQHWFTLVSAIFIEIVIFFVVLAVVITLSVLFPATSLIIVLDNKFFRQTAGVGFDLPGLYVLAINIKQA